MSSTAVPTALARILVTSGACALLLGGLGGCFYIRYLGQAVSGQLDLLSRREPIDRLLRSGRAPPKLANLLRIVPHVRGFAQGVGLEASNNYSSYAELPRRAAVWVVTACSPLAFEPQTWSFPMVGNVTYLGWFDEADARVHADELRAEGLDAYVREASAYSTLGWFEDPVLSTMIARGPHREGRLVNTVLHEAVHATVYVEGQTFFNEALAVFVADGLTPVYLAESFGSESSELRSYVEYEKRSDRVEQLLAQAYNTLQRLYGSNASEQEKIAEKARVFSELQQSMGSHTPLNNATLVDTRVYVAAHEAFESLFIGCHGDWRRFLQGAKLVTEDDFEQPQQEEFGELIDRIAATTCPE